MRGNPSPEGVKAVFGNHVGVQMARRNEVHSVKVIPQRWALSVGSWRESFTWLEKHRQLWKNGKPELDSSWQFIHMAFPAI